jgi:cell division protease FtsH
MAPPPHESASSRPEPPQRDRRDGTRSPPRWYWVPVASALFLLTTMIGLELCTAGNPKFLSPVAYTQFYTWVEQGRVARATIEGQNVELYLHAPETIEGRSGTRFTTTLPAQEDRDLLPLLRAKAVDVRVIPETPSMAGPLLVTFLPWLLIIGVWVWIWRRAQRVTGPGGQLGSFLRGRAKRFEVEEHVLVRFDDVAGLSTAKRDLEEVVEFLREPSRFRKLGGKLPRGVLLVGPPGTGKTLLARAVAGEAKAPFYYVNGSEFIQMFVGVGASRVRELFDEAKKAAPAIVFIDEIDAVGRTRGTGIGGVNDEREQTLNQLLSEMDGFTRTDQIIVLAATNRPDVLDAALLRPGRFDRRVIVERPEVKARVAILEVHTREMPLAPDVSLEDLAAATPGFSGADLANLANEAALGAARRSANSVEQHDFTSAMDKIVLGDPSEALLSPEERRRIAAHESGHAIVAWFTEHAEPLRRVSILPRGLSLGATQMVPEADRHLMTRAELEAKLRVLLGGYACEELLYGNVSSGSENDLREATNLSFKMVAHFGMSEALGPVFHEERLEHPFLGRRLGTESAVSDATLHAIEEEARRLLRDAESAARRTLADHRTELSRAMTALTERETLDKEDFARVIVGEERGTAPPPPRRAA